ncbi:unnamed protein product [Cyclocybe aegerita]|uniref:Uncharacterized protein n=1 Tax=Cyclocybe aegerita TaxID=1973307 RepID=A0A8S0Y035_CYCAE|nr:unnamed protein product [Cyclocybe aegerita]
MPFHQAPPSVGLSPDFGIQYRLPPAASPTQDARSASYSQPLTHLAFRTDQSSRRPSNSHQPSILFPSYDPPPRTPLPLHSNMLPDACNPCFLRISCPVPNA